MVNAPSFSLSKAIDPWENEGGTTALTEVPLRTPKTSRTGALADSGNKSVDQYSREARPRKTDVHN
jgi:hypothetical protein